MKQHNAPPVVYPVGPSCLLTIGLCSVWLVGLAVVLLWWFATEHFNWRIAMGIATSAVNGGAIRWYLKRQTAGQLGWDGYQWAWQGSGNNAVLVKSEKPLVIVFDLQHRMLVRFNVQTGPAKWLFVEQPSMPERWMDFRRAAYSPRKIRRSASNDARRLLDLPLWRRPFNIVAVPLRQKDGRRLPNEH